MLVFIMFKVCGFVVHLLEDFVRLLWFGIIS